MGSGCFKPQAADDPNYDINSEKLLDHYVLGQTLGRGAFGVVKVATMKPQCVQALQSITDSSKMKPNVARRKRFLGSMLAVKVMQQSGGAKENDSVEKLEAQINGIDQQIVELEKTQNSSNVMSGTFEELRWLTEYLENLKQKLAAKSKSRTKKVSRENMLREVLLMEKCDHDHIMQVVEVFDEKSLFCALLERCFDNMVSRYPQGILEIETSSRLTRQLLSVVDYLYSLLILHRDIKPENLLFRSNQQTSDIVLGDFGLAVELRKTDDRVQGCAGTPHFVPPEGFHSYYQCFASDVWASGCTMYWMLLGRCPYEVTQQDAEAHYEGQQKSMKSTMLFNMLRSTRMGAVLTGWKPQFEHEQTAILARKICHPRDGPTYQYTNGHVLNDQDAIDLLSMLLHKDPKKRVTAGNALNHPWLAKSAEPSPSGGPNGAAPARPAKQAPPPALCNHEEIVEEKMALIDLEPPAPFGVVPSS
eukprot:TRINITY_DN33401_c2_g1_i1.p1 TRINITY_DN33401_c2_g1~~TRINITY_DN33401_c2_g1_i1.p1  ORF type:complete len:475 (-),score=122.04 TRINITY_DN33401_c2_g1_i1:69-1493(-)